MAKLFEIITEVIGWIRIAISPTLIGFAIGAVVYFNKSDLFGIILAISVSVIGLIIGVILATRISIRKGTIAFLSSEPDPIKVQKEEKK